MEQTFHVIPQYSLFPLIIPSHADCGIITSMVTTGCSIIKQIIVRADIKSREKIIVIKHPSQRMSLILTLITILGLLNE